MVYRAYVLHDMVTLPLYTQTSLHLPSVLLNEKETAHAVSVSIQADAAYHIHALSHPNLFLQCCQQPSAVSALLF